MIKNINIDTYSKIFLGKSNNNVMKYLLKSKLNLSNKIITYPFGSNRTRFQFPEMFKYELKKLDTQHDLNNYELIVKRFNKPNCPKTAKFFWSDGWTFDLYISFIPELDINNSFLETSTVLNLLPYKYGNITIDLPEKYIKPQIGIVIPIFNRYEYLKKCFDSLSKTNLSECILVLVDESMTKEIDEDKKKVNLLVKQFKKNDTVVIKIFKNKHGNMFDSILHGFDLLSPLCEYLITIDSDTIQKINWIDILKNTYQIIKKVYHKNKLLLSGFNTITTNFHKILEDKESYMLKTSVGGCQMFFESKLYLEVLRFTLISHKWDTNLVKNLKDNNGIVCVTKPSVIDHLGIISSGHRQYKNNIVYDKALDF